MTKCTYAPLSGAISIEKYDEMAFKRQLMEEYYGFEINNGTVEITESGEVKWKNNDLKSSMEGAGQGMSALGGAARGDSSEISIAQSANVYGTLVKSEDETQDDKFSGIEQEKITQMLS